MTSPIRASWHVGRVASHRRETTSAVRLELDVPTWPGNHAGSHLDVRLTAPDGYQATRSYSVASSGETTRVILAVDELPSGEVSPYLVHQLAEGDELEVHGPLGRYFVWTPTEPDRSPVQLIAGGSGVVPLFAMAAAREHETVDVVKSESRKKFDLITGGLDRLGHPTESIREQKKMEALFSPTAIMKRPFGELTYSLIKYNSVQPAKVGVVQWLPKEYDRMLEAGLGLATGR